MIAGLANAIRTFSGWIPEDVWIWGSIALTILGKFLGLKWTAWLKTLLGLVCIYAILFCVGELLPVWLQNLAVIVTAISVLIKVFYKKRYR